MISIRNVFVEDRGAKEKVVIEDYDKTTARPAWIKISGQPPHTGAITFQLAPGLIVGYRSYLKKDSGLFVPIDHTSEELNKFYSKYAEIYDNYNKINVQVSSFLASKINLNKTAKVLDLGAGTGLAAEAFVQNGFQNITLLEYSKEMLSKAKEKTNLANCEFICADIKKVDLNQKFDLIVSTFSFAYTSYFKEEEISAIYNKVAGWIRSKGLLAIYGYTYEPPEELFEKIESGEDLLKGKYLHKWYIGRKRD
jgi:SAM-dependent methyltransferase